MWLLSGCGGRSGLDNPVQTTAPAGIEQSGGTSSVQTSAQSTSIPMGGQTTELGTGGASVTGGSVGLGGTRATGGSQSSGGRGGTSATGGTTAAGPYAGDYDLFIEPMPDVPGCTPTFNDSRLNVSISDPDANWKFGLVAYRDFEGRYVSYESHALTNGGLTFPLTNYSGVYGQTDPLFSTFVGEVGFIEQGSAIIAYQCTDGSIDKRTVKIRLLRDQTPPKLRLLPFVRVAEHGVLTFSEFRPEFSETVTFRNGSRDTFFWDLDEAMADVYVRDAVDTSLVDIQWMTGTAGGEAVFSLSNHRNMAGHSIVAGLNSVGLADRSGNRAVALDEAWSLVDTAIMDTQLDFDWMTAVDGLVGQATFSTAAIAGSPCSSGNCVVLEGPLQNTYLDWATDFPPAAFGLSFASSEYAYHRIHYQLWATSQQAFLMVKYPTGCSGWTSGANWVASSTSVDGYTYQTGWFDSTMGVCYGPDRDRGVAIAIGCENCITSPSVTQARLVIESITSQTSMN